LYSVNKDDNENIDLIIKEGDKQSTQTINIQDNNLNVDLNLQSDKNSNNTNNQNNDKLKDLSDGLYNFILNA